MSAIEYKHLKNIMAASHRVYLPSAYYIPQHVVELYTPKY